MKSLARLAVNSTPREVRLVPSEGFLSLFYPVFDLCPTVVCRNYFVSCEVRVGHDKPTRGKSSPTCHSILEIALQGLFHFSTVNVMDAAYKTKKAVEYGLSLVMCQIRRAPVLSKGSSLRLTITLSLGL